MKNRKISGKWLAGLVFLFFCCNSTPVQDIHFAEKLPLELSPDKGIKSDLIIYLTGDGGWNRFSENLVHEFEKQGYGVVSLNSLKYFWNKKSPENLARDLGSVSDHYLKDWNKRSLIIVGYSFGADVASFLPGYLSSRIREKIKKVALLSPSASTDFVIRIGDLLGLSDNDNGKFKVGQEIEKSQLPVICIFGKRESLLLKKHLKSGNGLSVYELPGGHRFDNNYNQLVQLIFS